MNMPGFVAETSLYKTNEHYHKVENSVQADKAIHLAADNSCPWWLKQTKKACLGATMWCRDYCGPPEGNRPISGWYFCGVCFGFNW